MRKSILVLAVAALLAIPMAAMADSISPATFSHTLAVGESVTITKRVTIDTATPTGAKVDILFLVDTTGSMGSAISSAKSAAANILSGTGALGDVAWGVAHYEDFPVSPYGGGGDVPYELLQDITASSASVTAGINALALGYGSDGPEADLYALATAADTVSWRDSSTRIIVWFGDAPGHDGDLESGYPSDIGLGDTIAALNAENITVAAIDYGYSGYFDSTHQVTDITFATGGSLAASSSDIVADITTGIVAAFDSYSEVSLVASGIGAEVGVAVVPGAHTGAWTRETVGTFDFDVTFTGGTPGTYDFTMDALVDGGIVAAEMDHIVVGDGGPVGVPEPSTLLLLGTGLIGLAGMRRRFKV